MSRDVTYFNGRFVPREEVRISPDDRGFLFGDGVYEVVRSYGGRLFALDAHLARMAAGLAALRIEGVDTGELARASGELLRRGGAAEEPDALVYWQVTRGAAPRTHAFPSPPVAPTVYGTVMPFRPRGDPDEGVAVITVSDTRWSRCDVKAVGLLPNCLAHQQAREAGAHEALFVRDGVAIEGTATSFFGVFDGEVRTAPRSNYILPGITRQVVLDLCAEHGIPAREDPIFEHEIPEARELFLAGTTVEVMPVVRVNGRPVGSGRPGPLTRRLLDAFRSRTAAPVGS